MNKLGYMAFYDCYRLSEIELFCGITDITPYNQTGETIWMFDGCDLLQAIHVVPGSACDLALSENVAYADIIVRDLAHKETIKPDYCDYCGENLITSDASLAGYSIKLKDVIGLEFYLSLDENAVLEISLPNGTQELIPLDDGVKSGNYYKYTGYVAAKEMTANIDAQVLMSDGTKSMVYTYSVQKYADYILKHEKNYASAIPVVKAMMNYGAYTQLYLGYNTDKLANSILAEGDKVIPESLNLSSYAYTSPITGKNVTFVGTTLILLSELRIKLYFDSSETLSVDDYEIYIDGKLVSHDNLEVGKDSRNYVIINGMNPAKMSSMIKVKVRDITVENVNVYGYIQRAESTNKESLKQLLRALYVYSEASKSYKGK